MSVGNHCWQFKALINEMLTYMMEKQQCRSAKILASQTLNRRDVEQHSQTEYLEYSWW